MTRHHSSRDGPAREPLRREDFPALRAFARGYLHEDFGVVHGSALAARDAFLRDATDEERENFFAEGARLLSALGRRSMRETRATFGSLLGASWTPRRREDLEALFEPRAGGGTTWENGPTN